MSRSLWESNEQDRKDKQRESGRRLGLEYKLSGSTAGQFGSQKEDRRGQHFTSEHQSQAAKAKTGMPNVIVPGTAQYQTSFRSFAQKIRHQTKDGWELVEAVYEVFSRARAAQADGLILDSATWLADRGFGKPVQVGQLLDGEGNPVAFTLWSPATQEPIGDVITLQNGKVVESDVPHDYTPPHPTLEAPRKPPVEERSGYGELTKPWNTETREKE